MAGLRALIEADLEANGPSTVAAITARVAPPSPSGAPRTAEVWRHVLAMANRGQVVVEQDRRTVRLVQQ